MKTNHSRNFKPMFAFTLVEMLIVISIIAVLAAMIFPAFAAVKKSMTIKKARAELKAVAMAIDSYKDKKGYYPPDHNGFTNATTTSLYFELSGVTNTPVSTVAANNWFETFDGAAKINAFDCQNTFGQGGIMNCSKATGEDGGQAATVFIKQLKPNQYGEIAPGVRVLTCSVVWPLDSGKIIAGVDYVNPWRYVSTGPTNNNESYDLWVDIVVGNKTNRISNWSETPEIVP